MHPNRVVAVAAAVLSLALAVLPALADADWTSTAGAIAGIAAVLGLALKFLDGSQKHEARQPVASAWRAEAAAQTLRAAAGAFPPSAPSVVGEWTSEGTNISLVSLDDPELDDPDYPDAPAIPTLEQHSNLGAPE